MSSQDPDRAPGGSRRAADPCATIPVLGIPVTFESNEPAVIEIAEDAFAGWRVLERAPRLISDERVSIRVDVLDGDEPGHTGHAPIAYHPLDGPRVLIHPPGSAAIADVARREAVARVTRTLIADRQHFRYGVLEALTLFILTCLDRQPLHAACIVKGERALLLAGPSGTGKSTIACAAARAGYQVLAEDYVNIQMQPHLRVWGAPGYLHLPPEALPHFPELAGRLPSLTASGKEKIALSLAELGASPALPVAQRVGLCLLSRETGAPGPGLETLEPAALREELTARLDPGFDRFGSTIGDCIARLAGRGGWRLRLGSDPNAALEPIAAMFEAMTGE